MITMKPFLTPALLVAGMLVTSPGSGAAQDKEAGPAVEIVVTNNAYLDMHIYTVQPGGLLLSVGMVTGLTTQTFPLPRAVVDSREDWRVLADPIGGFGSYLSDPILMTPEDEVDLTIQNNLDMSTVTVQRVR